MDKHTDLLAKARESLAGAESELAAGRYNNAANRAYYACFQAAVHSLTLLGVKPPGTSGRWGHEYVQARFSGDLIGRRKRYPADLQSILEQGFRLRATADYDRVSVHEVQTARAVRRAREFVAAVAEREGNPQ